MFRTVGLSIAPLMLSMVGLVLSADSAQAQLFGGRGLGIGIGVGRGGYYGGNYGNYGNYLGSSLGYSGGGYGNGYYGGGGRYWNGGPYYGSSWNSNPYNSGFNSNNYRYSQGVIGANYSYPTNNYSTQSDPTYYPDSTTTSPIHNDAAMIRVVVSDPQAQVWFDGSSTKQQGTDRMFHTGALSPNANYSYTIRAKWRENGKDVDQSRTVNVTPGQDLLVDFTRPQTPAQQYQPLETRSQTQPQTGPRP